MASTIRQQTVNITPVISTVTYTSGDQLGGIQALPIGLSETLLVELENIQLTDLAAQNAAITFHIFNSLPVIISTDNQPFNISAPELTSKLIISVSLPAVNYQTIALVGVGSLSLGNVNLRSSPYSPGLLYCVAVINQSATYTSTSSISIGYNVVVYDTSDSSQVTNVQLAPMGPESIKGNNLVTSGSALDLTKTQATAMLNAMTGDSGAGGLKGMVPAQAIGDGAKYLTGAGTWGVISIPASANPALSNLTAPTSLNRDLTFQGTFGLTSPDHINAVTSLTASTIISADASKNLVSLATATYPDLTELSYVKGVTSAVQTQINTKAPIASPTFTGTVGGITAAMVGAPSGSGTSSGTNTGDNSANSLYTANPMTTAGDLIVGGVSGAQGRLAIGSTEKVLATDGTAAYWAIEGVKTGYPAGTVVLGRTKPSGLASALNNTICGVGAGNGITSGVGNVVLGLQAGGINLQTFGTGITTGSYNIVLGAYSGGSIGFSGDSLTTQDYCIAIGYGAQPMTGYGIAIGYDSKAHAQVANSNSIAIGKSALAGNPNYGGAGNNISIGASATCYTGEQCLAIGQNSAAEATQAIAIGQTAKVAGHYSIVIGGSSGKSSCSGANNTVLGADSFNGASLALAVGNTILGKGVGKLISTGSSNLIGGIGSAPLLTTGSGNVILGNSATCSATLDNVVAIGASSSVTGGTGVAIGYGASVAGQRGVAIGESSNAPSQYSTAVGVGAVSGGQGTVVLGCFTTNYSGNSSIHLGWFGNNALSLGNAFFLGGTGGQNAHITKAFLGQGGCAISGAGLADFALSVTPASGANQNATTGTLTIAGAISTGTGIGGDIIFSTSPAGGAGSAQNASVERARVTYDGKFQVSSVTASQILASGSSKEVVSLSTATYPSLAELAYVKGVTSAVQTQLNSEATARAAAVLLAVPAQSGNTDKVLVTDGSISSWQYAGLGSGGFGTGNVFLGMPRPANWTSAAINSVYIGVNCGDSLAAGYANTAIGNESLRYNVIGFSNSALGRYALQNTTSNYNTAVGGGALKTNVSGANNSALGFQSLYNNVSGLNNSALGFQALYNATGTGNIAIGYYAGRYATASDEFYLNNQNRTDTSGDKASSLMYGTFNATASSQTLAINAAVSVPNNISISTAGYGLKIKEGSNARMGVATLVTGTVTVFNTSVTANTRIMLTAQNNGGTIGWLSVSARTASTSFTILSSSALDTSDVAWMLVEPA